MPNWVFNDLDVDDKEVITKYISKNEEGYEYLDFNKIIPMPEDLEDTSGCDDAYSIIIYLTRNLSAKTTKEMRERFREACGNPFMKGCFDQYREAIEENINSDNVYYTDEKRAEMYECGKKALSNYEKYGAMDWYYWRINNWGVKWNASSCQFSDDYKSVYFETPWGIPEKVLIEMSKQNPKYPIKIYSEEETGWWEKALYVDGHKILLEEGEQPVTEDDD